MTQKAFQDYYPDHFSHCYGCGRLNEHGMQIKSYWNSNETICIFEPKDYHSAVPGYVYGGLIASLIDCHSMGTAAAAKCRAENRALGTEPASRFMTASLHVNYLLPTPMGGPLEIRSTIKEVKGRKVIVESRLIAGAKICATGEVVAVQVPDHLTPDAANK